MEGDDPLSRPLKRAADKKQQHIFSVPRNNKTLTTFCDSHFSRTHPLLILKTLQDIQWHCGWCLLLHGFTLVDNFNPQCPLVLLLECTITFFLQLGWLYFSCADTDINKCSWSSRLHLELCTKTTQDQEVILTDNPISRCHPVPGSVAWWVKIVAGRWQEECLLTSPSPTGSPTATATAFCQVIH